MNRQQAFQTLGIDNNSSEEEAKKAFRKLAAKFHPDRNKEPDAEEQFKKINEAYQTITKPEEEVGSGGFGSSFNINLNDLFANFGQQSRPKQKKIIAQDISLPQKLSFKEAVIGCTKEITYNHTVKCADCNGQGQQSLNNGCEACGGSGKFRTQNGPNTIIERPCQKCRGKLSFQDCDTCKNKGYNHAGTTITVNIPPGAIEGSVLNLGARGNYVGDFFGSEQNSQLSLRISVSPQATLSIKGKDVICEVPISLLEAFRGCSKTISTIDGDKEIDIPKLIKNKEEVILPNLGIGRKGNQIVIINVNYPSNVDTLIKEMENCSQ